ncbi:amino acid racemase [Nocardioides sp. CER19]|uniref:aspartate/glutamate racemase family protein n=1 Tax=Nocardioides sp. CER19 TaxID=3038538 RepID=UPI00244691B5|nr:amino acid racemase [Nocardioides sp. CER19]MDH2413391.1 amino acid racemase [Nocardioides sp. CER19]
MQTIGLVGGMSWESSAAYYEGLNKGVQERLGGLHSAKVVMSSVDLAELNDLQEKGDWDAVAAILAEAARGVAAGGADFILLCSTTFHLVYDKVAAAVDVPVLHLADVLAAKCQAMGASTVGFIGTKYTMDNTFFAERIADHGLDVNLPDPLHVDTLDSIIYDELVFRKINPSSRKRLLTIIDELWDSGVSAVLLGATELSLLVRPQDVEVPVLDVITVHVEAALDRALA